MLSFELSFDSDIGMKNIGLDLFFTVDADIDGFLEERNDVC